MIPQQHLPWKVSITIFHGVATLTTCLRLEHRRRTRRLWWDDRAALVPAFVQFLNVAVLWLRIRNHPMPLKLRVLFSYGDSFCFGTIIWWSRISLALAVVRITPSWSRSRHFAVGMTVIFFVFWIALLSAIIMSCAFHTEWQYAGTQILVCGPTFNVTIAVSVLNIIGDIALIAIPLRQLWHMNHPTSQRRLVRLVFSASALTLLCSIAFCVVSYSRFIVGPGRLVVWLMVCYIAEAVSMVTSNILVLICWFRHYFSKDDVSTDVEDVYVTPHCSGQESSSNKDTTLTTTSTTVPGLQFGPDRIELASEEPSVYEHDQGEVTRYVRE